MTLLKNGAPVPETVKLKAVARNGVVSLEVNGAERADAGDYVVKLANSMGEVEFPFRVDVFGKLGINHCD